MIMTITLSTYLSQGYIVCSCLFKVIFRVPIGSLVPGLPFPVYCMSRMPDNAVTIARLVLSQNFIGLAGCARPIRVIDENFHYRLRLSTGVSVKLINKILCTLYIYIDGTYFSSLSNSWRNIYHQNIKLLSKLSINGNLKLDKFL